MLGVGGAWPAGSSGVDGGAYYDDGEEEALGPPDRGGRQVLLLRCCAVLTDGQLLGRLASVLAGRSLEYGAGGGGNDSRAAHSAPGGGARGETAPLLATLMAPPALQRGMPPPVPRGAVFTGAATSASAAKGTPPGGARFPPPAPADVAEPDASAFMSPEAALAACNGGARNGANGAATPPLHVRADCGASPSAEAALLSLLESPRARASLAVLRVARAPAGGIAARCAAAALRRCPSLAALRLSGCAIDAPAWARLAAAAGDAPALKEFEAEACGLSGERALAAAAGCLRASATLRLLNLGGNATLGDAGVGTLCAAISAPAPALRQLLLAGCGLGEPAARALAALLAHPGCGLTALDLGRNGGIGSAGGAALLDALATNTRLEALVLDACGLGAPAGRALAAGLRANGTLRVLDLADNSELMMGDEGGASPPPALADALWDNVALTALDVSGCGCGDAGAAELARGVASNGVLKQLRLVRSPRLGAAAAAALRQAAPPRLHVMLRDVADAPDGQ